MLLKSPNFIKDFQLDQFNNYELGIDAANHKQSAGNRHGKSSRGFLLNLFLYE